ncbi:hypothetical protein PG993_011511 [Apiospora rasikravindrae]|uniref:Uncharacterized protein n=1 Tax=Apiospora rasikravindrae TaxID=990691 RepID=A0ABR1SEH5_9PEZI
MKWNSNKNAKATSGAGGGYNLPRLGEALNNSGNGTYRDGRSIAISGTDLPVYKTNNPSGSGTHRSAMEPKTSASGNDATKTFEYK